MQGHGRIIAHNFCVAHREANSGLSTLNRTKSILSIYHQQRQLQKQRGMYLNDTYPFCQQPLSSNCHSICFSKPVLWAATPGWRFSPLIRIVTVYPKICSVIVIGISTTSSRSCDQPPAVRAAPCPSYQVLHILSRKALTSVRGFSAVPGGNTRIVPLLLPPLYPPLPALVPNFCRFPPHHPLPLIPPNPPSFPGKTREKR